MTTITLKTDERQVPVGRITYESRRKVWTRNVSESRHLFRYGRAQDGTSVADAWTIGEALLAQLRQVGVDVLRYRCGDDEYEIGMSEFMRNARELDQAAWAFKTEPQWAIPRSEWRRRRADGQLALFAEVGR